MRLIERIIEQLILASRWLLVPVYLALAATLAVFGIKAVQEAIHLLEKVLVMTEVEIVLAVLALIDLALIANLLVMVILSGYETFVSTLDVEEGQEKPSWLGKVDASTLKIKLAVSIVAISSIHLLRAFMNSGGIDDKEILWLVIVHLTFVVSALLLAVIDKIAFAQHRH
ncbi:MAG TPA: TIGR00645 family protein [Candidatus Competibacter sp.]|nr:TIGR00645 family protein [Candidatus Competibacter sp.]HUM91758.1 TIGR00645 family protein [Candidatus Competibacter sp.]